MISSRFRMAWLASGMVTIVIPLVLFSTSRAANNYNNNWQNGNNNNNNNNQNYNNQNGQNNNGGSPWWYWGSHQGQEAREEERAPPVLIAAYLWSLAVFLGVLFFGHKEMRGGGDLTSVIVALIMFACYSFISMLVFGSVEGAVETEGRVVEEHGFMGQFGVMMYITSLFWLVFSILFVFLIRRQTNKAESVTKVEVDSADYRIQDDDAAAV